MLFPDKLMMSSLEKAGWSDMTLAFDLLKMRFALGSLSR